MTEFNIAGKDWFTETEAAFYCGVSIRQFQAHQQALGLVPKRFMGRKLYGRAELYDVIAKSPHWDDTPSVGPCLNSSPLAPYMNLAAKPLRPPRTRPKVKG